MARPIKDGVDYWPLDVGFFDDKKIKLIKGEFGITGVHIAMLLINEVYRTGGYYKVWDEDDSLLMVDYIGCGVTAELVGQVVARCCDRGLFEKRLFDEYGVLTSRGIQRRFMRMFGQKRNTVPIYKEYWLLDAELESDVPASARDKIVYIAVSDSKTPVYVTKTPVYVTKTPVSDTKTTPEGAENSPKQSRENKTRQDESRQQHSEDGCGAAHRAFEQIKMPALSDVKRINELVGRYGEADVIAAINDAAHKGGRSIGYVERILEGEAEIHQRHADRPPEESLPAQDMQELEKMMQYEWFCDDEWLGDAPSGS